jgi:hypothetical protein
MQTQITLRRADQAHAALVELWQQIKPALIAGQKITLTVKTEPRTLEQNAKLWALLSDIAQQVQWHGRYYASDDWKHIFTAALHRQRTAPGIEGGVVVLGQSTSKMTAADMSALLELIEAFGAEHGVRWGHEGTQ